MKRTTFTKKYGTGLCWESDCTNHGTCICVHCGAKFCADHISGHGHYALTLSLVKLVQFIQGKVQNGK
jgi:uncharacterized UBP type Zn finger protein